MTSKSSSSSLFVVVLNNSCTAQGGASRVAIDEAVALSKRGAHVSFLGASGPICTELTNADLRVICLGQPELANAGLRPSVMFQGLWNSDAYHATASLLDSLDARRTIVHLHGFTQALSTSPVRCAVDRGFRVVYTLHDFFSACPNGAFFNYASKTPCELRPLSLSCISTNCDKRRYAHKLYRVARSLTQRSVGRFPSGVRDYIALSKRSETLLRPYLPADAHVYPIANPIEVPRRPPVDVMRNQSIVAVGRLDPEKGVEVLVEAAGLCGTPITFVGDGPLRALVEASDGCRVTGWLPRDAVLAELDQARCVVFPSLWYETYGLAVAEAAARGVPAIVSDISAAAERIRNNETGWHVRTGHAEDLARAPPPNQIG